MRIFSKKRTTVNLSIKIFQLESSNSISAIDHNSSYSVLTIIGSTSNELVFRLRLNFKKSSLSSVVLRTSLVSIFFFIYSQ